MPKDSLIEMLFTEEQLEAARAIIANTPPGRERHTQLLDIVTPRMPYIQKVTGRQNIASYLAYRLEYALT